jgi:outer membrane protein OmpA-like peptidoglycan-associated protein
MKHIILISLILTLILFGSSCENISKTAKGTAIGGTAGALAGAVIGKVAGNTTTGAIVGATVGGATGAVIGNYMDRQSRELEKDLEGAKIERVGEGIKITFDSGLLFDVNSSTLNNLSKQEINQLAKILQKYEDTNVMFSGHTDAKGSEEYNQTLSEKRATSVAEYTAYMGVASERMTIVGYGETDPVDSNETEVGRRNNRRVEVAIWANDKLKKAAEKGDI